ncbi:ABC transporter permease subunit [Vibrio quintilis]|uniref:Phosphate transport system permease protein PstC n=1 Tax=Vibrio quintilis TaxID=1117707 RepID=A0A1M7YZQ1_9VIBR|nr:ABC transporter permease subunit [Vibrio quintilis]SHO58121.1 Phosphate transport system permease protein PstC [Vibrio quintilis]
MSQIHFSLKAADKKRLIKDRLMRYAITAGGGSVFGALILIFFYLAWVGLPLFSAAEMKADPQIVELNSQSRPAFMAVDKHGQHVFTLGSRGDMAFVSRTSSHPFTLFRQADFIPRLFAESTRKDWFAILGKNQQLMIAKPVFSYQYDGEKERFTPGLQTLDVPPAFRKMIPRDVRQFNFTLDGSQVVAAFLSISGELKILSYRLSDPEHIAIRQFHDLASVEDMMITPDGHMIYLREASSLIVIKSSPEGYKVREVVDLSLGNPTYQIKQSMLLAGGESVMVLSQQGVISQWFDVVKNNERHLTHIRDFDVGLHVQSILPDTFHKGFFVFDTDGRVRNYYATTKNQVFSGHIYTGAPELAVLAGNEKHLVTYRQGKIQFAAVDLRYPEISFSALWQKVWYENYPEPDYVWQSTSVSDVFEPKFSLVPIVFGTVKAAFYAMLLAVPIAVLAAIYTAYFMSPGMRRKVKPAIELMEALPTVIIGFLAGLWLAPIVERHLVSVLMMVIFLPVIAFLFGVGWYFFPEKWRRSIDRGWHAVLLVPILMIGVCLIYYFSFYLEAWFFEGDVRYFLVQYGIDFDQRNALVVGLAMGFAVIPTIFTIAEDAVFSVPKHLSDGSSALGATRWQTLVHVVLLTASPGIFSAMMIGIGRAVGETMIVLMATGNTPIKDWNIFEGMRTLAATIAVELPESEVGSSQYRLLFLAALILFVFTFLVNSLAEWVRLRLREKYRAL